MNRKSIRNNMRAFLHAEDGASTVLAIFWFMLFCALGGLAVDITNGFRVQGMMQATADAAAHAAVMDLPDETTAEDRALAYTEINMPADIHGTVLVREDIEIGVWDPNTRTFAGGVTPANAVRVTLHSTRQTGNSVPTSFLRIIGLDDWNVSVAATAAYSLPDDCLGNGFVARGWIETGSTSQYYGVCIHGEEYVKFGSGNTYDDSTEVSMLDLNDLEAGSDNEGLEEALYERSYDPPLVDQVHDIITGLADGSITPPNFLGPGTQQDSGGTQHVSSLPSTLEEGTLYIVEGSDDVTLPADVRNVGVVVLDSEAKLNVESDAVLYNVLLAARGNIEVGSYVTFGSDEFCSDGHGAIYAFTEKWYKAGSNNDYSGVQIVATDTVDLGSNNTSGGVGPRALTVQAGGDIKWGSDEVFRKECRAPSFFSLDGRLAIVD